MTKSTDPDPLGATLSPLRIATPEAVSRVDTLPEDFARMLGQTKVGVGATIGGRYRLLQRLGAGGMGEVFVAENQAIGLHVAVKVLKHELLKDPEFRRRFQREAEAIAAVIHPNVARFLDLVVGDPTFLVMEYVQGETLAQLVRAKRRLPVDQALRLSIGLCRALKAVHAAQVVHRDLKPSNVIVTADVDYGETAKLIDFGLAKVACLSESEALTRTGAIIGTPAYMSPEQIAGRPVDAPADIYSLGCLLYYMLAGQPPFTGDDVQVLFKQMHESPVPISTVCPDVPPALAALVDKAMSKDPLVRHADMEALQRALVAVAQPRVEVDDMTTIEERRPAGDVAKTIPRASAAAVAAAVAERRGKRRRRLLAVAAAVTLVGFGIGFGFAWLGRRSHLPINASGTLIVLSHPAGANVSIDGATYPQLTPAVLDGVQPGTHSIALRLPNHSMMEQRVLVSAGERAVVEVALPPILRRLELRSSPPGAEVYVDGRLTSGNTPTAIFVTADDFHRVHLVKNGYEPRDYALKPEMNDNVLSLELDPGTHSRGTIEVESLVPAEVWIDGAPSGSWSPTRGIRESSGEHKVQLKDASGLPLGHERTVVVKDGETVRVSVDVGAESPEGTR